MTLTVNHGIGNNVIILSGPKNWSEFAASPCKEKPSLVGSDLIRDSSSKDISQSLRRWKDMERLWPREALKNSNSKQLIGEKSSDACQQ